MAIPTAMPDEPFIKRFGSVAGNTTGSLSEASKFGTNSTVSFSRSANISSVMAAMRASVYLMAAGASPSTEPKFPCPSANGYRSEKSWTILTSES